MEERKDWQDSKDDELDESKDDGEIINHDGPCLPDEYEMYRKAMLRMNRDHAVVMVGSDCLVMNEFWDPLKRRRDVNFSSFASHKNRYLNRRVINPWRSASARRTRDAGSLWLESKLRREYSRVVFDPSQTVGPDYYNLFRGFNVKPDKQGTWLTLRRHIRDVICDGDEDLEHYVMGWMARMIQDPGGIRPGTALVFKGHQGCGKGTLANALGHIIGAHYRHILQPSHLTGQFNAGLKDALFIFCDEVTWGGDRAAEGILKGLITEPTITIEHKGKDTMEIDSHINVMIASNNDWIIPAGLEERRFCVMQCSPERVGDRAYFDRLYNELSHQGGYGRMMYDLMTYDYSDLDLRTIPRTGALFDQIVSTMNPVHKFWYQILIDETLEPDPENLMDFWDATIETDRLYERYQEFASNIGQNFKLIPNQFAKKLKEVCPNMVKERRRSPSGKRLFYYVFPDLETCRKDFERSVSLEIDWNL